MVINDRFKMKAFLSTFPILLYLLGLKSYAVLSQINLPLSIPVVAAVPFSHPVNVHLWFRIEDVRLALPHLSTSVCALYLKGVRHGFCSSNVDFSPSRKWVLGCQKKKRHRWRSHGFSTHWNYWSRCENWVAVIILQTWYNWFSALQTFRNLAKLSVQKLLSLAQKEFKELIESIAVPNLLHFCALNHTNKVSETSSVENFVTIYAQFWFTTRVKIIYLSVEITRIMSTCLKLHF